MRLVEPTVPRRGSGNDDHEVALDVPPEGEQRTVHLTHHLVGGGHRIDQERLGSPRQRQLTAHRGQRCEGEQRQRRVQTSKSTHRVTGLSERNQGLGVETFADVACCVRDDTALGARDVGQRWDTG